MSPEMLFDLLWKSLLQTLHMVAVSGLVGSLVGLPIGVFLATSGRNELFPAPALNRAVGLVVNAARSTPFIILVVAIIPPTSRKAPKRASAVAVSATRTEAMAMIVAWPRANHRPTATGRCPCCINLRVTLSIAAM